MNLLARLSTWGAAVALCAVGLIGYENTFTMIPGDIVREAGAAAAPKVLVLKGSPYERGLTHGKTLRTEIRKIVEVWKADLARQFKVDGDTLVRNFFARTGYVAAARQWTPSILDEVRGISDGSGIDFETVFVFQLVDEVWANMKYIAAAHCSSIGVSAREGAPAYVAQNMDLETLRNGFQALLHIRDDRSAQESYVFTCAGLIGLNGMNNRSVGVCVNTVAQLSNGRNGLPVSFVVRGLLERSTAEEAVEFLQKVKHASGQNYIIGGRRTVYDFEASSGKVVRYLPAQSGSIVYHTNHPLVNDDYNQEYRSYLQNTDQGTIRGGNSYVRFQALEKRLGGSAGPIGVDTIKSILQSKDSELHPICRAFDPKNAAFTFGSVVMVLSGRPELHFAPGPPDVTPFEVYRFDGSPK